MTFQRILKPTEYDIGMVYRVSETVVTRDFDSEDTEWVMKITKFIVYGPIMNRYHLFVDGQYEATLLQQAGHPCRQVLEEWVSNSSIWCVHS